MQTYSRGETTGGALGLASQPSRPGGPTAELTGLTCMCGHAPEAHEHYRRGTDCALCPPGDCGRYSARR